MFDITLKVEIAAGSVIDDVAVEMVKAAEVLNTAIEGDFNGVNLRATPETDAKSIVSRYHCDLQSNAN